MNMGRGVRSIVVGVAISVAALAGLAIAPGLAGASGSRAAHQPRVPLPAAQARPSGAVYAISNDIGGNTLVVFDRRSDGSLRPAPSVPTGGLGSGVEPGTQGAVVLSDDGRWLLAVNPGSDDVSLFAVHRGRPVLVDVDPSGGDQPVSVTVHGSLMYVLNAGDDTVAGLRITRRGLVPVAGSTRSLSGSGVGPAQVELTSGGHQLVVTEKNTNMIDVFPVDRRGRAGPPTVNPSNGVTPFGFAIDRHGRLIVSNANGGATDASSLTSYAVHRDGTLTSLDGPDGTTETAACWVVVTGNGRYAYTTNTGSASITGYRIGRGGSLTILDADGVTGSTGTRPIDIDLADGSRFLYTLNGDSDSISIHRVEADGSLTARGTVTGLAATAVGLAAS
jgi:6-phosphogluconolactonase